MTLVSNRSRNVSLVAIVGVLLFSAICVPFVSANRSQELQAQINQLSSDSAAKEQDKGVLGVEANSLADAINKIQAEINASESRINQLESDITTLKQQIVEAEAELVKQREVLGQNIKEMYIKGDISTVEMLATSKDLSDYFDQQQYRQSVQNKVKTTLDTINQLKADLDTKKESVERSLLEQKNLRAQQASQRAEKDRVLALNQSQQGELEKSIKANNASITELKKQQVIENQKLRASSSGNSGGVVGGGSYPWGSAPCLSTGKVDGGCYDYEWGYNGTWLNPQTGYAYRNCTDWVAWKGGFSSGLGNATNWPDRAGAYGYTSNRSPAPGAAAVNRGVGGGYGHVMFVEAVNGDGSIVVSDYNGAGTGKYDSYTISAGKASTLYYVHK